MLDFQRRVLYDLKKQYGNPISVYVQQVGDPNLQTGQLNTTQVAYRIRQAIVLPAKFFSQGFYGAAFLKAHREFAYGAFQSQDMKTIVLDAQDLPAGLLLTPEQHVVYKGGRFEIFDVVAMEDVAGYILTVKRLTGVQAEESHAATVYQSFRIAHSVRVNIVRNLTVSQTLNMHQGGTHQ